MIIVLWCNGNTSGFGPEIRGSSPCGTTKYFIVNYIKTMWLLIVWLLELIGIIWILIYDKFEISYQKIKEWFNKPIK